MGPAYAKKLIGAYGDKLIEILDTKPSDIERVRGIGPERRRRIAAAWKRHQGVREIMMFLAEHGVSTAKAKRIHDRFGDAAVGILRGNPYQLTAISGFGFLTADEIAQKMGIAPDAPQRLCAGILHVLETASLYGHCGLRNDDAIVQAAALLKSHTTAVAQAMNTLVGGQKVFLENVGGGPVAFLPRLAVAEVEIAARIAELAKDTGRWHIRSQEDGIAVVNRAESACGITLSASQRIAVHMALVNNVLLITGGPGCGKTTTTQVVLKAIASLGANIALAAPTGRAAKRLSDVTGRSASTIHRLVGRSTKEAGEIDADLVLIDEASMVDVELMLRLMRGLKKSAALILVGDADQLPSVGPGRVFGDLIDSKRIATATLTEIHRQAAGSPIVQAAHDVREGRVPHLATTGECVGLSVNARNEIAPVIENLMTTVLPEHYGLDVMREVQVLTPMRKGPAGSIALNERLQKLLNPNAAHGLSWGGQQLAVGDRVIQIENDYDRQVFNGDAGIIAAINTASGAIDVSFEGRIVTYGRSEAGALLLSYAVTIHKSQGAEWRAVVLSIAREHYKLLSRRLLYTALTRGKQFGFVVSEDGAIAMAVQTNNEERVTALCERIIRYWN